MPLGARETGSTLSWLYRRFFEQIEVDQGWAQRVREAEARGTVIYVLRNLSFVDFLALDYLTRSLGLPEVRFANDLGLWVLEPLGRGWLSGLRRRSPEDDLERLRRAIRDEQSAALFLKRPPTLLDAPPVARQRAGSARPLPTRGKSEGDAFLRTILEVQRSQRTPILLVPQVFVWTRHPDAQKQSAIDALFGPREWPGKIRTVAQFLANSRHVTLRAGDPVDVQAFLAHETHAADTDAIPHDDVLVRRLTYALLRKLERERRSVLGPAKKPPDRLRDQVVRSPRLQKLIREMAGENIAGRRVLGYRALAMLRELQAEVDTNAIRALDALVEQTIARMYSGFDIDAAGIERLREASKDGTLVLLPSHKSHVDYIVLSRIFHRANMPVPLVAAGDNLSFFPLGPVLRRAGAFFIRRDFKGDRLYGAVVDAYMRRLLKDGWPLEFFIEGGRSRTGKLLPPKVGLLSIVVDAALAARIGTSGGRNVYFCPISIGYERIVEEESYVHELSGGEKRKEDVGGLLRAAESALGRYGRLNVQVGELLTLEGIAKELGESVGPLTPARRRALVTRLAYRTMNEINRVTSVVPSALVAAALLTHDRRGLPHSELVQACERLARMLRAEGARFSPSLGVESTSKDARPSLRASAIREACELLVRAGHIEVHTSNDGARGRNVNARPGPDAIYVVPDEKRLSLDIAKNLLVHFFLSRAMIATPLVTSARRGEVFTSSAMLAERVQALSRLFKYEFQFRADAPFETIFAETKNAMADDAELTIDENDTVHLASDEEGLARATLYANMLRNFVEGYRIAARSLTVLLKGPVSPKDLGKRALALGERMFLAGELACREAVSRPIIDNAFLAFVDQGYLGRREGKYVLPESYATAEAAATVEAHIVTYLPSDARAPARS